MYLLGSTKEGDALIAVPRVQRHSVIRSKARYGFNGFAGAIPQDYQPPLPRKARELYGTLDVGFHKSNKASGGNCDVTEILKKYEYNDTLGWASYCDCMYDRTDPLWKKCNAIACGNPFGCTNPSVPGGLPVPFDINPFLLVPPWEDAGAGARGLPKPQAGIMADIAGGISINWDDYQPLTLWTTFWANPTKFGLLMAKLAIIPIAGGAVAGALTATGIPFALIPFAIGDAQKAGLDTSKALLDPVLKHAKNSVTLILKYLGKCGIGINVTCGAGLVVQRAAQDQIDSGEINKMYDPTLRAVVAFLAKTGDKMVDAIINSIDGIWNGGIFSVMESGFAAARDVVPDVGTKKVLDGFRIVAGIGNVIASDMASQKSFDKVADDIGEKLLGFRPSIYFKLAETKGEVALTYAKTALDASGSSLDKMTSAVGDIVGLFDKFIQALDKLGKTFGGAFDEIINIFQGASATVKAAGAQTQQMATRVAATAKVLGVKADGTLRRVSDVTVGSRSAAPTAAIAVNSVVQKVLDSQPQTPVVVAPPVKAAPTTPVQYTPVARPATWKPLPKAQTKGGSGVGLLATAGLGFAVGGPAGAAIGLVAGAVLSGK